MCSARRSSMPAGRRPIPITSNSSFGEGRCDRSANSSMVRHSSERSSRSSAIGTTSLMKPGLLPVANSDEPPSRQAASNRSTVAAGSARRACGSSAHVLTTFLPDASSRHSSSTSSRLGMWRTQSASSATSSVDVVGRRHPDGLRLGAVPGHLAGVEADLGGVEDPHAHHVEVGMFECSGQGPTPDGSRCPLDDAIRHSKPPGTCLIPYIGAQSSDRGGASRVERSCAP